MSAAASEKTLFMAWQDHASRGWFPIGRLDVYDGPLPYGFRYTRGAELMQSKAGYPPLIEFPELKAEYRSDELFPIFRNRVMSPSRPDFADYLRSLDLEGPGDPIEILSVNGGWRATDAYEVFPKIEKRDDGSFVCRFFLHGRNYAGPAAKERIDSLRAGDELRASLELNNPATGLAVQIQTEDYHIVGWTPRYLVSDLIAMLANSPDPDCSVSVVRVNPMPAPASHRVLVEMRGSLGEREPMSGEEYQPLAP